MEWLFVILIFWILGGLGANNKDAYILWTLKIIIGFIIAVIGGISIYILAT